MSAGPARDQALRLRVFRFVKDFYEDAERWPTRTETAHEMRISVDEAVHQLRSLYGAEGLPKKLNRRGVRQGERHTVDSLPMRPVDVAIRDMNSHFNASRYIDLREVVMSDDSKRPWEARTFMVVGPGGRKICHCGLGYAPPSQSHISEANARLIAAAPVLHDAMENLLIAIGMGWDLDGVVEQARAALAAAEGGA